MNTNFNLNAPLYSLTVREYIALNRSLIEELLQTSTIPLTENKPVSTNPYVSIKDASLEYGIPVNTLYAFNAQKRIPVYQFGKKKFYKRMEIELFIESSRKSSLAELKKNLPVKRTRKFSDRA